MKAKLIQIYNERQLWQKPEQEIAEPVGQTLAKNGGLSREAELAQMTDLRAYLEKWSAGDAARTQISNTIEILAEAGRDISAIIARGPLEGAMGAIVGGNADGDQQKALDLRANDLIIEKLKGGAVSVIGSEELDDPLRISEDGPLCVAMDPLDGSSNIDCNVSIGTIFAILPAIPGDDGSASLFQPGNKMLAAGYIIYGPHTALVLTVGEGSHMFTLDRDSGKFILSEEKMSIPAETAEFAINASNLMNWFEPVSSYISDCLRGKDGPRGKKYNMRWVASLIAECHRIFSRGGIFLYPGDSREGYKFGRLRLVYEANPISFLVEQAGGRASTGQRRIMDIEPTDLHQRVPLVFGSSEEVRCLELYCEGPHMRKQDSPLFGQRGLFRT